MLIKSIYHYLHYNMSLTQNQSKEKMSQKSFVEQNEHFKVNSAVENGISLCIPRMFNNIGFNRVKGVFIKQNWGFVERVDVIHYGDHKKAFVHFRRGSWNWNTKNAQILDQLQRGEQIHLRYENGKPWFWHVGVSYVERPKKEDVNYYPTGVMNLKKTTQGDELLKRKRVNQLVKESVDNRPNVRDGDDPIKARMNENSPKARETECQENCLADGLVKEDEWRCGQCRVVNKNSSGKTCGVCKADAPAGLQETSAEFYAYDPQTEDTYA